MNSKKWWLSALLVGLVLFLVARTRVGIEEKTQVTNQTTADVTSSGMARASTGDLASAHDKRPLSFQRQYDESDDLWQTVAEAQSAAANGDGNATWVIAKAYEECLPFSLSGPAGFQRDMEITIQASPDHKVEKQRAFKRIAQRCAGFVGKKLTIAEISQLKEKAAKEGNLAAKAEEFQLGMMTKPDVYNSAMHLQLTREILRSRDPEAVWAIGQTLGANAADRIGDFAPMPVGSQLANAAWGIAACRLGKSCGPQSPTMVQICLSTGSCGNGGIEDFYLTSVVPAGDKAKLWAWVQMLTTRSKSE